MQPQEALFWCVCAMCVVLIVLKISSLCTVEGFQEDNRDHVLELHGVLTSDECNALIAFATSKGMKDSEVMDKNAQAGAGVHYSNRKSKQAWIDYDEHPVAKKLSMLSRQLTGYPESNQEMLQVAMYEEGGEFKAHYDACSDPDKTYCDRMNRNAGQRRTTLLVYLNEEFDGGETTFVNKNTSIKPKSGNAVMFWDTYEDESLIEATKHRGMPVHNGNKWIATVWSHPKPYSG